MDRVQLTDFIPDPAHDSQALAPVLLYDRFVEWTSERGIQLYPAQDEAVTELVDGKNVIMATPTGSGKSMVALRSEEHTSELQSRGHLVCRLLLENKTKHPALNS